MKLVFSEELIRLTQRAYIGKCADYAKRHDYRFYVLDDWRVALGAPSYAVSMPVMTKNMENLQRELFATTEGMIAIVPVFCVINGCTVENFDSVYNRARLEMLNKNMQFYVCDAKIFQSDEESIRERYHMVNVINYAIAHDKIIPYYQGIHDNATGTIHHYESLMRLEDENGTYARRILELQAEVDRLRVFEDEYEAFEERVRRFDINVVYNSQAPDIEEYKKYYEEINPETAAEIYRQVVEQLQYDDAIKQKADLHKNMKPGNDQGSAPAPSDGQR